MIRNLQESISGTGSSDESSSEGGDSTDVTPALATAHAAPVQAAELSEWQPDTTRSMKSEVQRPWKRLSNAPVRP